MSVGTLIALIVFLFALGAIVFKAATPEWLPLALIALLALGLLLYGVAFPTRVAPS